MPKSYCHLTYEERCQIEALKKSGLSVVLIAEQPGRHRATIYREINRNSGKRGYRHKQAQEKTKTRRRAALSVPWRFTPVRWTEVVKELEDGLSPEQISGRFQLEGRPVGRQQIYNFVHADRRAGGDLWTKLRRRGKKPNKKGKSHAGRGLISLGEWTFRALSTPQSPDPRHIPGRVDISERPAIVEEKVRVGDWEVDTIVGKGHSGAVVSLADRATKYTLLGRVDKKTKEEVCSTSIRLPGSDEIPVHTITADNGKEFADHSRVAKALEVQFFFAKPYHSWQRGLNEHTNGLVREYFPKGTDFRKVSDEEAQKVQDRLNVRPRKVLRYRTPTEAMFGLEVKPYIPAA